MKLRPAVSIVLTLLMTVNLWGQAHTANAPPPPGAKNPVCTGRTVPQLVDVTKKVGITFEHLSSPEKKYIVESMAGGVIVIDYDRDGWPDLYFTNAPTVE
ncbi:MAG: CRTAC1 family protein, partial [Terriglobales bacterium]